MGGYLLLRKYSEVFRTLCAVADLGIVALAWAAAYLIRFHAGVLPPGPGAPRGADYVLLGGVILPVWRVLLSHRKLYAPRRGLSPWDETRKLIEVSTLGTLIITAVTFFWKSAPISRLVLLIFWGLSAVGLSSTRLRSS